MAEATAYHGATWRMQALYVRVLLRLLPLLVGIFRRISPKIKTEIDYLQPGYTFQLSVAGTSLCGVYRRGASSALRYVPASRIARDVEPGSGLASADPQAVTVAYVIAFRSVPFAFACFSGGQTLKDALAQRAFSTRGPNDTGVALTYMFTALLKMFFGWRAAYRNAPEARRAV